MTSNLEKYRKDLDRLISMGNNLYNAMRYNCDPEGFSKLVKKQFKEEPDQFLKNLPSFNSEYQSWYSESLAIIKVLLPDRVVDFTRFYERPKARKVITYESYVIADYLDNLIISIAGRIQADISFAIRKFQQQLYILKSAKKRFESSLFDIEQVVQADLLDSELDAAKELNKKGFSRGAGAIVGVVLEKHLFQVCKNHNITVRKRHPAINDYNELLKQAEIIQIQDWRFIQRLADLRNLCDHNKDAEPTKKEVEELINGAAKISKTIY